MNWDALNIVGVVAFAVSGALVGVEESYDLIGVFVLGIVTAFGGGIIKDVLVGIPVTTLWSQQQPLVAAVVAVLAVMLLPGRWVGQWRRWGVSFDAIGLATFATQAALQARRLGLPLSAVLVAAVLTGVGGGIARDVLAGRKPLVLRDEIYAVWALLAGAVIWVGWAATPLQVAVLVAVIVALRTSSVRWRWKLPRTPLPWARW
ncbi:MAG: trimeric intracellular cation channel family protein [Ktedonobacterales bacterium]|nr:trimeric intracellular cation channel family protein [Ktedonobacterales bacterium]